MRSLVLCLVLLAGCGSNTAWQISTGNPQPDPQAQVQFHSNSEVVALFGLAFLAAGLYEVTQGGLGYASSSQRPPEMAPDRRISEQDCTKPIDLSLGNLRCK